MNMLVCFACEAQLWMLSNIITSPRIWSLELSVMSPTQHLWSADIIINLFSVMASCSEVVCLTEKLISFGYDGFMHLTNVGSRNIFVTHHLFPVRITKAISSEVSFWGIYVLLKMCGITDLTFRETLFADVSCQNSSFLNGMWTMASYPWYIFILMNIY